jgi:hypothetical protein
MTGYASIRKGDTRTEATPTSLGHRSWAKSQQKPIAKGRRLNRSTQRPIAVCPASEVMTGLLYITR